MSANQTCKFYMVPKKKDGKTIHVEYAHIRPVGTPISEYKGPATEKHRRMFAREYGEFVSGKKNLSVGEPITSLPNIEMRVKEMLLQNGINTIEELAATSDQKLIAIPDGVLLKKKALAYMAALYAADSVEGVTGIDVTSAPKRGRKPKSETVQEEQSDESEAA